MRQQIFKSKWLAINEQVKCKKFVFCTKISKLRNLGYLSCRIEFKCKNEMRKIVLRV